MPDRRYRVLAVATHPVQYMTPIFRRMAEHPLLDFQVAYCSLRGAEAGHDPEFGADILLDARPESRLRSGIVLRPLQSGDGEVHPQRKV